MEVQRYTALMDAEYQRNTKVGIASVSSEQKANDQGLRSLLGGLQRPIDRIETRLQDQADGLKEAERAKILEWLLPIAYVQHHVQTKIDVLKGAGK